jgi:hypothetical protein
MFRVFLALILLCLPVFGGVPFQGPSAARSMVTSTSLVGHMGGSPIQVGRIPAQGRDVDVYVAFSFDSAYQVQNLHNTVVQAYTTITGANLRAASAGTPDVQGCVGFCNVLGSCSNTLDPYTGSEMSFTDTLHQQDHGDAHFIPSGCDIPAQYMGRFYAQDGPINLTLQGYCNVQNWETAEGHPWHYDFNQTYTELDVQGFYRQRIVRYTVGWQITIVPVP